MDQSEKSIVIFGAGKIGRSFIGQLFSRSGYKVIFIDLDQRIISELNRRNSYLVVIKSKNEKILKITNVSGVSVEDREAVIDVIADCSLMATCVGKNAFPKILPLIAKGIEKRFAVHPDFPLDIILAENIREACQFMKSGLTDLLGEGFPVDTYLGFVETSIGKMVPIMPIEIENIDPLLVYAEPYNTLILDKNGFKNPVPQVSNLSPKENIKAWVDRKAFIHNLGHAAAAYFGFFEHPDQKYLYEVLDDPLVFSFTREAMLQSAEALMAEYPGAFTNNEIIEHIDDLLKRFLNKALGDSVFRIGSDLKRKLGGEDRIMGAIKLARKHSLSFDRLLDVLIYGLLFRAKDESGQLFKEDIGFIKELETELDNILVSVCGFDKQSDGEIIYKIENTLNLIHLRKTIESNLISDTNNRINH